MMELDIATSQALQNSKNGLSEYLRKETLESLKTIPEYFDLYDARRPP